ncbi:MAG: two-component system NtrC family sensor kinase [Myxococcota bacterium]
MNQPDDGNDAAHRIELDGLRHRAEARATRPADTSVLNVDQAQLLLHELRVHQLELEMQNEELRNAQLELDLNRKRYFDLYDMAPLGYLTISDNGLITEANLRAARLLGVPRSALTKQPMTKFVAATDKDRYYHHRRSLRAKVDPQTLELRLRRADGHEFWASIQAVAVAEPVGPQSLWLMINDISETRELEVALAQADRMATLGLLAASVGHEINNPLTYVLRSTARVAAQLPNIATAVQRCREAIGDATLAEYLGDSAHVLLPSALTNLMIEAREAAQGAQRIMDIAADLSALSQADPREVKPVDLNAAASFAITATAREVRYRATLVSKLGVVPPVMASPGKLVQIFVNLLMNAAHAIKPGAAATNRVTVLTWATTEGIFAEVSDTGAGMSVDVQRQLFEPFFTTKGPTEGTGLGLTIVQRIMTDLGGEVSVISAIGSGTRLLLRFPIATATTTASAATTAAVPAAHTPPRARRGRVLLVDDDPRVLKVLAAYVRPTHDIVSANSGAEAQALLTHDRGFDAVVCDLMMPGTSGVALHRWLVAHDPGLAERVAFVTGGVFVDEVQAYLATLANPIVYKPFDAVALMTALAPLVAASHARRDD